MVYYTLSNGYSKFINITTIDDIYNINNYDDICDLSIKYLLQDGNRIKITELPRLPSRLKYLDCSNSLLEKLPEFPDSLEKLKCCNSRLKAFPDKLPPNIRFINVSNNNIKELPDYLLSLKLAYNLSRCNGWCRGKRQYDKCQPSLYENNGFMCRGFNKMYAYKNLIVDLNPVHKKIMSESGRNKFNERTVKFLHNSGKRAANKIGEWFLECKYNPKYKYCRARLENEFNEFYVEN